jgi:chemotaxis protein histidine kinase CheA
LSLDKRVVEAIRGPLVHLIRNAVDHGIEAPEVRRQRGKQSEGALVIRIEQQQDMASIEVSDDGGGLDLARIEEMARKLGLLSDQMPVHSMAHFIFAPGFTTLETATKSSGRGVGLNAVKSQVEALCGSVEVRSTPGQGTRFLIRIPIELGSSQQLTVRCGARIFGIPLFAIVEVIAPQRASLHRAQGSVHLARGGQMLQVVDLGAALKLRADGTPDDRQRLLVIATPGERPALALAVDEVLSERELVVRPLPSQLREVPAYLGVSTLPNGEPLLVLRPEWLVGTTRISAARASSAAEGAGGTRTS